MRTEEARRVLAPAMAVVCEVFGVTPGHLLGRSRHADVLHARKMLMWLGCRRYGLSLPAVGRALDRHHTTVLSARRSADHWLETSAFWRAEVATVEARIAALGTGEARP